VKNKEVMMIRFRFRFSPGRVIAAVVATLVAACAGPGQPAGEQLVRIGHAAPTSGALAHLGRDNEFGATLAIEELNAKRLVIGGRVVRFELVTKDDAADPRRGAAVAQELVDAKVAAVVGHLNSGTSIPAASVYAAAGIAQITPSATNPRLTRLGHRSVFRLQADDHALGTQLAQYAKQELKLSSAVVVDDRTAYGQGVADAFEERFRALGGQSLARQFSRTNPSAQMLASVVQAAKAAKPDVIFYGGMDSEAAALLRALRAEGINTKLVGGDGICSADLPKLAKMPVADVLCAEAGQVPSSQEGRAAAFAEKFKLRFGVDVVVYAPYTYDAVYLIADAMQRADSTAPDRISQALRATKFDGVTGPIAFDGKGDVINGAISLYSYSGDKRTLIGVIR
jgi:branched-chain amino acid transport system substrate-binding protein